MRVYSNRYILVMGLALGACDGMPQGCNSVPGTGDSAGATSGSGPGSGPDDPDAPGSIDWQPCVEPRLEGFDCATIEVPLDHQDPDGEQITLALSRNRHTDPDYRGVILSHPGGPGGSGRYMPWLGRFLPNDIGAKYDWVSLDPRGVGASVPSLACDGGKELTLGLPFVPQDEEQIERWKTRAQVFGQSCQQGEAGKLLPHLHTSDLVKDLEQIRNALGVEQVTFYGSSYGSYVGELYATMYPERIKAMILESIIDPTNNWYESNLLQQEMFSKTVGAFYAWVAENDEHFKLGAQKDEVKAKVEQELARLEALASTEERHPSRALSKALGNTGYGVGRWPRVANALSRWIYEKDRELLEMVGSPYKPNLVSNYLGVHCSEVPWPTWDKVLEDARISHEKYPEITWHNTWLNSPCVDWPIAPTPQPKVSGASLRAPVLLTNETWDAATPFSGALAVRRVFADSVLIEGVDGYSHSTLIVGNECTQDVVYNFLDRGELPPRLSGDRSDVQCPPRKPEKIVPKGYGDASSWSRAEILSAITMGQDLPAGWSLK